MIDEVYDRMFDRTPDQAGVDFYVERFNQGETTFPEIVLDIFNGAQGTDATILDDKVQVALLATEVLIETGHAYTAADIPEAQRIIASVTQEPTSVTRAQTEARDFIIGSDGGEFRLTLEPDSIIGTSYEDSFNAPRLEDDAGAWRDSLQDDDSLNGGDGTDTLNATLSTGVGNSVNPTINNIEVFNLTVVGDSALDLADITGVTEVWNRQSRAATLSIENAIAEAVYGVDNTSTVYRITGLQAPGSDDTLTLALQNAGNSPTDAAGLTAVADRGDFEQLEIVAQADNWLDLRLVDIRPERVTLRDEGAINFVSTLQPFSADLQSLDAQQLTGGLSVDISNAVARDLRVVTGAGDDTIIAQQATLTDASINTGGGHDELTIDGRILQAANTHFSLDLGAGNNRLNLNQINDEATLTSTLFNGGSLSNVGTLGFNDAIRLTTNATLDLSGIAPSTLVFANDVGLGLNTLIIEAPAAPLTLNLEGDVTGGLIGTIQFNHTEQLSVTSSNEAGFFEAAIGGSDLTRLSFDDNSVTGDARFSIRLEHGLDQVDAINFDGGTATQFSRFDASAVTFQEPVEVNIADFGVDQAGANAALVYVTDSANGVCESFNFIGSDIADIEISGFFVDSGDTGDRLDFSGLAGISNLNHLNIARVGRDTVISAVDPNAFAGEITLVGINLTDPYLTDPADSFVF